MFWLRSKRSKSKRDTFLELMKIYNFRTPTRNIYVMAANLVDDFRKKSGKKTQIRATLNSEKLRQLFYRSSIDSDVALPFLEAEHVKDSVGTGLVHTSYAHGFEDYNVSIKCCVVIHTNFSWDWRTMQTLNVLWMKTAATHINWDTKDSKESRCWVKVKMRR